MEIIRVTEILMKPITQTRYMWHYNQIQISLNIFKKNFKSKKKNKKTFNFVII